MLCPYHGPSENTDGVIFGLEMKTRHVSVRRTFERMGLRVVNQWRVQLVNMASWTWPRGGGISFVTRNMTRIVPRRTRRETYVTIINSYTRGQWRVTERKTNT